MSITGFYGKLGTTLSDADVASAGEELYNEGKRTLSDIISALNAITDSEAAESVMGYSDSFAATLFNESGFNASDIASIVDNANLTPDKLALVLENTNLSLSKAVSIFDDADLSLSKAGNAFGNSNLSNLRALDIHDNSGRVFPSDWASIFDNYIDTGNPAYVIENSVARTVSGWANLMNNANISAGSNTGICNNTNITSATIKSIIDTGNFTDTSRLAATVNGSQLTAGDAATHINSAVYTDSKYNSALVDTNLQPDKTQFILQNANLTRSRRIYVLTGNASDLTVSSDTTITGTKTYAAVTVNSGYTLTHDGQPGILICRSLTNNGTYEKTATGGAGHSCVDCADGGNGGGGLIIYLETFDNNSSINADGESGYNGDTCGYEGNGSYGTPNPDLFLIEYGDAPGEGGGAYNGGGIGYFAGAGGGANAQLSYPGGDGGVGNSSSYSNDAELADKSIRCIVDSWMQNVVGKTPSSTEPMDVGGAGGGSGGCNAGDGNGGGGGGAGGQVIIQTVDYDNTGTISADGGDGGDAGTEGGYDSGGAGAGGGIIYGLYKNLVNSGTRSTSGGAGGTAGDSTAPEDGTAGTSRTRNA